ncbi:MAG: UDP-N-acetylglucosamine 2-epimerase [Bdellovibrionales bacterium]
MRTCFIIGTAAELIKIYPLIVEADERNYPWTVLSTGQSPISLKRQYDNFQLPEDRYLKSLNTKADLSTSWQAMKWFVRAWIKRPRSFVPKDTNVVIVHGDTFSTIIGAKWGRRLSLPVVHIEAGLRSGFLFSPFPEEINRRIVSRYASVHMAPDDLAAENLKKMGYDHGVFSTGGNTLSDTVRIILQRNPLSGVEQSYVVANIHRYENLTNHSRWKLILETLVRVGKKRKVLFVMHPQTKHKIEKDPVLKFKLEKAGIQLVPRLPFTEFINLLAQADFVVSDGGSNQEECHYLGVPCLILRDTTERAEGLHSNCLLSKFQPDLIDEFLEHSERWKRPASTPPWSPSSLIIDTIERTLFESSSAHQATQTP